MLPKTAHGDGEFGNQALSAYLQSHGAKARFVYIQRRDQTVGEMLLASANSLDASAIIMGCDSHSPIRETVFGGFTEHVLLASQIPLFYRIESPRRGDWPACL